MKIIIPMAGRGTRLRPHTLTIPKPLLPIAGKPIVQRLVEDIAKICKTSIEEIVFIIGDFGKETEEKLLQIAQSVGAKGKIVYQDQPLGTAHAILCAEDSLEGNLIVAFADTLFRADFAFDNAKDGIIWVKQVEDPSAFGVVKTTSEGVITDFVEKPKTFVSDLAIIGIYYFADGKNLRQELQYLIDNNIKDKGEYQLTSALENMKNKGVEFLAGKVDEWLDCGNKDVVIDTNRRYLDFIKESETLVSSSAHIQNTVLIQPVYVCEGATIEDSVIGPYVSIGKNTQIKGSVIRNSIVQESSSIQNANLDNSMIGNFAKYEEKTKDLSIGDYCIYKA